MKEKDFISLYGEEPQEVTKNYATKSLGTNYDIKDAFIEFGDNAYDARVYNKELNFSITTDDDNHMFIFHDDGTGIADATNLFRLGGTDKENNKNKIGKYGIGVPGAVSAIATQCRFEKDKPVEITFESSHCGTHFTKHILISPNGNMIIGHTTYSKCNDSEHGTTITFTNVILEEYGYVIDSIEETFEIPIQKDFNICFNSRTLGKSGRFKTFLGDEGVTTVMVGDYPTDVRYRILSEDDTSINARSMEEAGLRVYDKTTGRLLAKSTDLWKWYAGKQCQQTVCGLRAAIYIESSIESYNKFGIRSAKNGVTYKKYCTTDKDFKNLSELLLKVYTAGASVNSPKHKKEEVIKLGRIEFQPVKVKMDKPYQKLTDNSYMFKEKCTPYDIASMINTIIELENKINKLSKKSKSKKEVDE